MKTTLFPKTMLFKQFPEFARDLHILDLARSLANSGVDDDAALLRTALVKNALEQLAVRHQVSMAHLNLQLDAVLDVPSVYADSLHALLGALRELAAEHPERMHPLVAAVIKLFSDDEFTKRVAACASVMDVKEWVDLVRDTIASQPDQEDIKYRGTLCQVADELAALQKHLRESKVTAENFSVVIDYVKSRLARIYEIAGWGDWMSKVGMDDNDHVSPEPSACRCDEPLEVVVAFGVVDGCALWSLSMELTSDQHRDLFQAYGAEGSGHDWMRVIDRVFDLKDREPTPLQHVHWNNETGMVSAQSENGPAIFALAEELSKLLVDRRVMCEAVDRAFGKTANPTDADHVGSLVIERSDETRSRPTHPARPSS